MMLITDGEENPGVKHIDDILDEVESADVTIDTLAIGYDLITMFI